MVTMHARPRQTGGQTDEHYGNSATIRSNERHLRPPDVMPLPS